MLPNVMAEWLTIVLRIREVSISNIDPGTGYPDRDFSWLSKVCPGKCWDSAVH
jgi:hypothetical protein